MKRALSIAGFDPTGLAGVLVDAVVFSEFGLAPSAAITALTVQDLEVVSEVSPVDPALLGREIEAVLGGPGADCVKIGMLGTGANAEAVARALEGHSPRVVVLDPVLGSTGGTPLLERPGIEVLKRRLIPLCTLLTPNLHEAAALTGLVVKDMGSMREAAGVIVHKLGAGAALIKGGHLEGQPVDLLHDGSKFVEIKGTRLEGPRGIFHGTGCLLSSALAACLVEGLPLQTAATRAKAYIEATLEKRGARREV